MTCEKKTGSNYWTPTVLCSTVRIIAITLINYLLLINKKEQRSYQKQEEEKQRKNKFSTNNYGNFECKKDIWNLL